MSTSPSNEQTFRSYTPSDAELYAQNRQRYSDGLYQKIFDYHTSTGGELGTVVDVGCGPGIATFKLAETFPVTIGLDPSEGMITAGRALAANKAPSPGFYPVRFEVSTAEDVSADLIPDSSVDLITAATCAHWFNLAPFYRTAARLLKPHGTLALWTSSAATTIHPSVPAAAAMNAALRALEAAELQPFIEAPNLLARGLYSALPLPWTVAPRVSAFGERAFRRIIFGGPDKDEQGERGKDEEAAGCEFFEGGDERWFDMGAVERIMATASPVARWREANRGKEGTEEDIVRRMRRIVEELLREAGVPEGEERVRGGMAGALLILKKEG